MPTTKTQEHAAVEKPHTKPGRKPLLSEPKNKRTAQNRAAQRAFRERKERRMQELEEKVKLLEQEKSQIANESELLRIQVKALMKQLGKSPTDDFEVKVSNNSIIDDDKSSIRRNSLSDDRYVSSNSSISSTTPGSIISDEFYNFTKPNSILSTNTPSDINNNNKVFDLQLNDKLNNKSFKDHYDEHIFCKELSKVCGSSSCPIPKRKLTTTKSSSELSSPSIINGSDGKGTVSSTQSNDDNNNSNNSNNNNNNNSTDHNLFTSTSSLTSPSIISSSKSTNLNAPFTTSFLDTTNDFNSNLNINEKFNIKKEDNLLWNTPNGLDSYAFLDNNKNDKMDFLFDDSNKTENLNNNLFDHKTNTLQFDKSDSPINNNNNDNNNNNNNNNNDNDNDKKKINNEGFDLDFDNDDIFDDLLKLPFDENNLSIKHDNKQTSDNNNNNNNNNDDDDDDNEKVPDTTQNLMKCSQIWERITTHPRLTDIDIDNLCDELKQKAKCSESGVVVDGSDVGKLLHKVTCEKQKELEKNRETNIKRLAMNSGSNSFLTGFW